MKERVARVNSALPGGLTKPVADTMDSPRILPRLSRQCANCGLHDFLPPCILRQPADASGYEAVMCRHAVREGSPLYLSGEAFHCLYVVRTGLFKSTRWLDDGRARTAAFALPGEILGMDGIATGIHANDALALADSDACALEYSLISSPDGPMPALRDQFRGAIVRAAARAQNLSALRAREAPVERVALFLLDLSDRFIEHGHSGSCFALGMSRDDIADAVGLAVENLLDVMSILRDKRVIAGIRRGKQSMKIHILDFPALRQLAGEPSPALLAR